MKKIPFILASRIIASILSALLIFHSLILVGAIPYDMVWGGRLESRNQMIQFEITSLIINLSMLFFVAMKAHWIKEVLSPRVINLFLWIFAFVFAINTIGNLLSLNSLETIIFTPVTLLLSVLMIRVAIEK